MSFKLDRFTTISLVVIIAAFIAAWIYIIVLNRKNKLLGKRRWVELLPSIISTLGVLGTFLGITRGLLHFDTENLDASIPGLLDGLKTAFFTSLAGMAGSLILSRIVSRVFDMKDKGVSDINVAASQITQAVEQMCQTIVQNTTQQTSLQSAFFNSTSQILQQLQTLQTTSGNDLAQLITLQNSQTNSVGTLLNQFEKMSQVLAEANRNIGEITTIIDGVSSTQNDISEEVKAFGGKLHGEIVEIEDSMDNTNKLLATKFEEFSKLLEKSNTEALVEVMKKVTEEFNKQMSNLINKLVQENFEQLNHSVEQLNSWQKENKEMIASLTKQYKAMEKDFENTSNTLTKVGNDTTALVSDGGKLHQIVEALNMVMIEDKRFVEMVSNLNTAAELNKSSMIEFKDAQSSLNDWVRKQRNFVDAVQALIKQLEDISKINDYSNEFWKETRKGMNDGLSIIKKGSQQLIGNIENLDGHFYNRLNTTLANLDQCIQQMMDNYN